MSHPALRVLVCLALAWPQLAGRAEAGVAGSALAALGRAPSVRLAQFVRPSCWYADGWNGRGWYRCGDERNEGFGWIGPLNFPDFSGAAIRRLHRHGVVHPHPPTHVYEPPRGLSAGRPPPFHSFGAGSGFRRPLGRASPGAGSVHAPPAFHPPAPASPGLAVPHIGAPASPGFAGHAFHGPGAGSDFHRGGFHVAPPLGAGRGPAAPGFRAGAPSFGGRAGGQR